MLTTIDKENIAIILSIVFDDSEFLSRKHRINDQTVRLTEEMMSDLFFCNRGSTIMFAGIRCIPKTPNIYGWLIGCAAAVVDVFEAYKNNLQSNMLCLNGVRASPHSTVIKMSMF